MVAGGSGVVPFRSMLRHWAAGDRALTPRLLYSSRSLTEVIYREELMRKGKLSLHGHIAGQQGHVWIYHVDSVDELDEVMSADPMSGFYQNNPVIHAFCSYERMHDREREFFPDAAAADH